MCTPRAKLGQAGLLVIENLCNLFISMSLRDLGNASWRIDGARQSLLISLGAQRTYGKMFSQRGRGFPWAGGTGGGWSYQRAGELQAYQMVAIGMIYPQYSRPQIAGCLG
jgi:hypothetical protein